MIQMINRFLKVILAGFLLILSTIFIMIYVFIGLVPMILFETILYIIKEREVSLELTMKPFDFLIKTTMNIIENL